MPIPTEPIGSIPRPLRRIEAVAAGDGTDPGLDPLDDEAIRDTIGEFEATGSPVVADGEPREDHNGWASGAQGPRYARVPVKRAAISPSAPSLLDPAGEIPGDPREPSRDDTSTTRETAFAKIRSRVLGTALASERLGVG